jgi:hypothetical protein
MLAISSIAMSRVMLSIHSLAAKLGSESGWFFNNMELNRTKYRMGAHEGELIVERFSLEDNELEKNDLSLKTTRVGIWREW